MFPDDKNEGSIGFYRVATSALPWIQFDSLPAINLGTLGATANGTHLATTRGVAGALVADPGNFGIRTPIEYSGSHVYVPYQTAYNQSAPFSIELWVKPLQTAEVACPAASYAQVTSSTVRRDGWILYQADPSLGNGNGFYFRCYETSGSASFTYATASILVSTGSWYHVVGVFDGSNVRLYVNGVSAATAPLPSGNTVRPATATAMTFGTRSDHAYAYVGDLDEAAYYSRALTTAEVLAHFQAGTNQSPSVPYQEIILNDGPSGYWRFNEP